LDIWIVANYYKLPIILLYYPNTTLIETQQSFSTLSTYFYDTSEVVELQEADAERRRDSSSESEEERLSGMGAQAVSKKYMQEYYFVVVPRIKNEGVEIPTYSVISKDDRYLLPLSAIRPQVQDKILEEMSKHYVSSSDISSGRGIGLSMDDLDNVFERELKKEEFTESKEYIVSFVRNFNLYTLLRERERAMSVFSAESQTPPPELDVGLGENPEQFPIEQQLLSQKKSPTLKSKKHVMPLSSVRVEKEVAVKASATKKPKPTPTPKAKLAALSMVKESVEMGPGSAVEPGLVPAAPKPKKPRQRGIAIPKLTINPLEDTPSQSQPQLQEPLLLPTFQAKGKGKSSLTKLKPLSVSSSAGPAPSQQPEEEQGEEQGE
jgi:hypothetical protein